MRMTIETYGDRFVVIEDEEITGIFKTKMAALDAAHRWNRKIWNWTSLLDQEAGEK